MGDDRTAELNSLRLTRRSISAPPVVLPAKSDWRAAALSCLLHVLLFLALAFFWQPVARGLGGPTSRPIGIAIAKSTSNGTEYFIGDSSDSNSEGGSGGGGADGGLPSGSSSSLNADQLLEGLLPSGGDRGSNAGELVGSTGLGTGGADVGGGAGIPKAKTSVFGISGTGTRFVYVFDRSDSMNGYGGAPLAAAKRELIESLKSFGPVHQFQIVFYNDTPSFFRLSGAAKPTMMFGEPSVKSEAVDFVKRTIAIGGTEHASALKRGLSLGPDVIFFLTDANLPALSAKQIDEISNRAIRSGTTIHTIEFGAGPGGNPDGWIARLATETNGQYRYVNVQSLVEGTR